MRPNVVRIGQIGLYVRDLAASREFYEGLLGFVVAAERPGELYLRGYEERAWSLWLKQAPEPGLIWIGYKVASEEDLDRLLALARERGLPAREEEGFERPRMVRMQDPTGFPLVFYHREHKHERLLQAYHRYRGPGVLRIDHANVFTPRVAETLAFYREALGFRLTEYTEDDQGRLWAAWVHRKGNVHDLAFTNGEGPRLHHFAYWLPDPMSIIRAADILAGAMATDRIERGPGRHGISNAMFLYLRDPDGHRIELYTSDYLTVDPDFEPVRWSLNDPRRQTLWGHRTPRSWFLEGSRVEAFEGGFVPTEAPELEGLPEHVT